MTQQEMTGLTYLPQSCLPCECQPSSETHKETVQAYLVATAMLTLVSVALPRCHKV